MSGTPLTVVWVANRTRYWIDFVPRSMHLPEGKSVRQTDCYSELCHRCWRHISASEDVIRNCGPHERFSPGTLDRSLVFEWNTNFWWAQRQIRDRRKVMMIGVRFALELLLFQRYWVIIATQFQDYSLFWNRAHKMVISYTRSNLPFWARVALLTVFLYSTDRLFRPTICHVRSITTINPFWSVCSPQSASVCHQSAHTQTPLAMRCTS